MKKTILKFASLTLSLLVGLMLLSGNVIAEENEDDTAADVVKAATSISISPVNKILKLEPNMVHEDYFTVTNNSDSVMRFEVYASPYSYTFSEEDDEYKLGFSKENAYTQIVRWSTFKDASGSFVKNPQFKAEPGEKVKIVYRISTPSTIPGGGQYAVLFAHTLSDTVNSNGIKTEASPGLVVYGRSNSETVTSAEISDPVISQTITTEEETKNIINAYAKIKNNGNVDFMAYGNLKVEGLFGIVHYETPSNQGLISVIPEVELTLHDQWDETPYFGFFKATWTVSAGGETETITKTILIMPAPVLISIILLLTIIIVWITLMVRRRKERRARLTI